MPKTTKQTTPTTDELRIATCKRMLSSAYLDTYYSPYPRSVQHYLWLPLIAAMLFDPNGIPVLVKNRFFPFTYPDLTENFALVEAEVLKSNEVRPTQRT